MGLYFHCWLVKSGGFYTDVSDGIIFWGCSAEKMAQNMLILLEHLLEASYWLSSPSFGQIQNWWLLYRYTFTVAHSTEKAQRCWSDGWTAVSAGLCLLWLKALQESWSCFAAAGPVVCLSLTSCFWHFAGLFEWRHQAGVQCGCREWNRHGGLPLQESQ